MRLWLDFCLLLLWRWSVGYLLYLFLFALFGIIRLLIGCGRLLSMSLWSLTFSRGFRGLSVLCARCCKLSQLCSRQLYPRGHGRWWLLYILHRWHLDGDRATWSEVKLSIDATVFKSLVLYFLCLCVSHGEFVVLTSGVMRYLWEIEEYLNCLYISNSIDHHAARSIGLEWEVDSLEKGQ